MKIRYIFILAIVAAGRYAPLSAAPQPVAADLITQFREHLAKPPEQGSITFTFSYEPVQGEMARTDLYDAIWTPNSFYMAYFKNVAPTGAVHSTSSDLANFWSISCETNYWIKAGNSLRSWVDNGDPAYWTNSLGWELTSQRGFVFRVLRCYVPGPAGAEFKWKGDSLEIAYIAKENQAQEHCHLQLLSDGAVPLEMLARRAVGDVPFASIALRYGQTSPPTGAYFPETICYRTRQGLSYVAEYSIHILRYDTAMPSFGPQVVALLVSNAGPVARIVFTNNAKFVQQAGLLIPITSYIDEGKRFPVKRLVVVLCVIIAALSLGVPVRKWLATRGVNKQKKGET